MQRQSDLRYPERYISYMQHQGLRFVFNDIHGKPNELKVFRALTFINIKELAGENPLTFDR